MHSKAVLFDLENNIPNAQLFKEILEHYPTIYLFNCIGKFEYALEDLTELASWLNSGQIIILETPKISKKEFEYAMVVGQLMALLDATTHIEVISAVKDSELLVSMLQESGIHSHLIKIVSSIHEKITTKVKIPQIETIINTPDLQLVKKYCDALSKIAGKPNTLEKLKNSIGNILKLNVGDVQKIVGMLINLKIVKKFDLQIEFRKKVLKQWQQLDLNQSAGLMNILSQASTQDDLKSEVQTIEKTDIIYNDSENILKDFATIDLVQVEIAKKLRSLKSEKPKDIYALRDLLEQMFPQSDVRLLLKELLEKGYIYWNGHEIMYSHEMFLN